jgi:hypothetical protein
VYVFLHWSKIYISLWLFCVTRTKLHIYLNNVNGSYLWGFAFSLYVRKYLHYSIISLIGPMKLPPLFIEVSVPNPEVRGHIYIHVCVLGVSILPLVLRFFYSILEQFRQCGIFIFSFYCNIAVKYYYWTVI